MSQVNLKGDPDQLAETVVVKNAVIKALLTKSPDQIENWINNNVTDLASAKDVLTKLSQVVSILVKNAYKDYKST